MPKLTEDLVPGVVTLTTLHKVLQNLLDEKVPIRDMRTILETLAEHAPIQSDPHELTAVVRVALGRAITQQWFPGKDEVHVIGLDTPLERLLLQALQGGGGLEPGLADRLLAQTQEALSRQEMLGAPPVLLVNHALRPLLSRFLRRSDDWRQIMRALLAILLFPLLVQAAGEGMWQASSVGVTLNHRGESMSSAPLSTRQPAAGLMTLVAWRYQLIGPTPAGLRVRLCSQSRCVELEGQSGTTVAFSGIAAAEPLRFIWEVPGGGRLIPPLKIQRNEVIVNYR